MSSLRTSMWVLGGVTLFTGAALLLGPRVRVDTRARPLTLPADLTALDAHLTKAEAAVPDLRPGTEKRIIWADPKSKARTPVAVVYLHGFSATRQETAPLSDIVADSLGANLYYPRLAGHGRDADALGEVTAADWLHDAREALAIGRMLGEEVVLVGTSTGGTLATWLAATEPEDVAALVLISPNFGPKDPNAHMLVWPWGRALARMVVGPYREWTPANPEQERYWSTRYASGALVEMMGLVDLIDELDLNRVTVPTLVLYSPDDEVIDPGRVVARFPEIGAAEKALYPVTTPGLLSNHVIAGDILAPQMTEPLARSILQFLRSLPEAAEADQRP